MSGGIGSIWNVNLQDDVTANAYRMAHSLDDLTKNVADLGTQFKDSNKQMDALEIGMKEARALWQASAGNAKLYKAALKDAGVSAMDTSLFLGKMNAELRKSRREALGLDEVSEKAQKLERDAEKLAAAWKAQNKTMTIGGARSMWKAAGQDGELMAAALKKAGVGATESRMLLQRLNSELDQTKRRALGLDGIWSRVFNPRTIWVASHAMNVASKTMGAMSAIGGGAWGIASGVAGSIYDYGRQGLGSVIGAATSRQNQIAGMSYMLQKPGVSEKDANAQAADLFKWAQKYAKDTPLDTSQITGAFGQFLTAEFDPRQAKILTQVMADQASKFMNRPEMAGNVISAYSRMKGRGTATGDDLESMRVAGMNDERIMEALRERPELKRYFHAINANKSMSPEMRSKKTKEILGTGQISTMSFIQATIDALEKDRPDIGKMAEKLGATSLQGTLSNLQSAWTDLLESVDLDKWPGIKAFQSFLVRINTALDSSTASGQNLLRVVEKAVENIFGGLNSIEQSDIDGFVARVGEAALGLSKWLRDAYGWFDRLIHSDASFTDAFGEALMDVGVWIGQGLWKGATTSVAALTDERFAKKHGGLSKSTAEYQATLHGKSVAEVANEYDAAKRLFDWQGKKVDVPWGSDASAASYDQVMGGNAAGGDTPAGLNFLAAGLYRNMYEIGVMGAQGLKDGTKGPDGLDAHSPSRAMMEIGEMGAQGLIKGAQGGLTGGRGSGAGFGDVHLHLHGVTGDAVSGWEAIRPLISRELTSIVQRAAAEG